MSNFMKVKAGEYLTPITLNEAALLFLENGRKSFSFLTTDRVLKTAAVFSNSTSDELELAVPASFFDCGGLI